MDFALDNEIDVLRIGARFLDDRELNVLYERQVLLVCVVGRVEPPELSSLHDRPPELQLRWFKLKSENLHEKTIDDVLNLLFELWLQLPENFIIEHFVKRMFELLFVKLSHLLEDGPWKENVVSGFVQLYEPHIYMLLQLFHLIIAFERLQNVLQSS